MNKINHQILYIFWITDILQTSRTYKHLVPPKPIMEAGLLNPDTWVPADIKGQTVNVMKSRKPSKVKVIMQAFRTLGMRTASDLHDCGPLKMKKDSLVWTYLETPRRYHKQCHRKFTSKIKGQKVKCLRAQKKLQL